MNIDAELIQALALQNTQQEIPQPHQYQPPQFRSFLINPASKEFMSIDAHKRITTPLHIINGEIQSSLILNRNDTILKICDEFQRNCIYEENGNKQGSFVYGFCENGDNIFAKTIDFSGSDFVNAERLIQYDQKMDSEPAQWSKLEMYKKYTFEIGPTPQLPDNINTTKTSWYWFNLEPEGFIVVFLTPIEKTLITSVRSTQIFGYHNITQKNCYTMISRIFPELQLQRMVEGDNSILYSDKIFKLFPKIQPGIIKISKYNKDTELRCYQTHINCC